MLTEILLLVLLLLFIYSRIQSRPSRLPPGPWGWPVIGVLPRSDISLVQQVKVLRDELGENIISWRVGGRLFIFLCNYKLIKHVFSKAETSDRPGIYSYQSVTRFTGGGVIGSNGKQWQGNRRFVIKHLRDLGLGRSSLETAIQEETTALLKSFEKQLGSPQCLPWGINVSVMNVIWKMVAGRRYETDDATIIALQKNVLELNESFEGTVTLLDTFPWLIPILPYFVKKKLGMTLIVENITKLNNSFQDIIDDHMQNQSPDNTQDLIHAYLNEMKNQENVDGNDYQKSIMDLQIVLSDLFIAGSDTTASTLRWSLVYLAKYQDIQSKAQKEIDSVVPRDQLTSLQDKERLPYIEALTYELHRIITVLGLGAPHYASEDIEVDNYIIPKGSILIGHLQLCNYDPECWEEPEEFKPERFLDDQGNLIKINDGFAPFSVGRRVCLGESLARMEFYLFLSALLQRYTFSPPDGQTLSTERDSKEVILNHPKDVELVVQKRI